MRYPFAAAAALALSLLAAPGLAQPFPAAFMVTGVAENDVLNIRAQPSAASAIIGQIGPYGFNIEVLGLSPDGRWGQVGVPEGNGWVNMRYLDGLDAPDHGQLPRPLSCFGTEPFWSIGFFPRGADWSSPDRGHGTALTVLEEDGGDPGYYATLQEGPTLNHRLIISRQSCSDGMSDRRYGFAVTRFTSAPDRIEIEQGCCTLDHR